MVFLASYYKATVCPALMSQPVRAVVRVLIKSALHGGNVGFLDSLLSIYARYASTVSFNLDVNNGT